MGKTERRLKPHLAELLDQSRNGEGKRRHDFAEWHVA